MNEVEWTWSKTASSPRWSSLDNGLSLFCDIQHHILATLPVWHVIIASLFILLFYYYSIYRWIKVQNFRLQFLAACIKYKRLHIVQFSSGIFGQTEGQHYMLRPETTDPTVSHISEFTAIMISTSAKKWFWFIMTFTCNCRKSLVADEKLLY